MSRFYPERPVIGIGAVLLHNSKILLEKRKNDPGRGKWSIPGGLVEVGENLEQTVVREVKEETGLVVDCIELIDVVNQVTLDENGKIKYHFVILDYLTKISGGTLNAASDADELRWVLFDEVDDYDLTNSFRRFFAKNKARLVKMASEQRSS